MERLTYTDVTVWVLVYNHKDTLARCLNSILSQRTSYTFRILVHDDASTDGSIEILRRTAQGNSYMITPVYEAENQYSKGKSIVQDILLPITNSKYAAFCEGDDCWCDINKLQRQIDYMEEHTECVVCAHNTIMEDDSTGRKKKFFRHRNVHIMNDHEIFHFTRAHASSYCVRTKYAHIPEYTRGYWFGDYIMLTQMAAFGTIACLPQAMSIYHAGHPGSITTENYRKGYEYVTQQLSGMSEYLKAYRYCMSDRQECDRTYGEGTISINRRAALILALTREITLRNGYLYIRRQLASMVTAKSIGRLRLRKEMAHHPAFRRYMRYGSWKEKLTAAAEITPAGFRIWKELRWH